mmetsp:Transcript_29830/g.96241  ORF Transcript_29830/g.96241 Transcript_29830/m.96241 type:complete len:328 (+) Transcript_29830:3353-4336(+)
MAFALVVLLSSSGATSALMLATSPRPLSKSLSRQRLGMMSAFSESEPEPEAVVDIEDVSPSDMGDSEDPFPEPPSLVVSEASVLARCAATGRGALASDFDRADVDGLCAELETRSPGASLTGRWQLAYSSEAGLYRSSPFFWGFKKLLRNFDSPVTLRNAKDSSTAENIYAVTDGLPFYDVGACTQTISPGTFVSEVEVRLKVFESLVPKATSVMTTTARAEPTEDGLLLTLETTQVKDSSIEQALPAVFGFLSDFKFPTESAFRQLADQNDAIARLFPSSSFAPDASTVNLRCPYVSNTLRITRTDSGMLFVHVKDDDNTLGGFAW